MTNIELFINNQLCDIINPETLGVRLNRVLVNPAELNTKDAQYSYSVTIPSTPCNNSVFGYANIEETKNKFNQLYTARLYVNSVKIFDGRFKLAEIDTGGNYKGNLVIPAPKTIKEIFGEKKMNQAGEWLVDVDPPQNAADPDKKVSFPEFISNMNLKEDADCIFPLVLYGLLPKQPKSQNEKGDLEYSGKTLWDDSVRFGIEDFPPSINCLKAIRKIFESLKDDEGNPVNIGGSAFGDERLKGLYMSYQNPADYEQPWNWGQLGRMRLRGTWTNIDNNNTDINTDSLETQFFETNGDLEHAAVNIFDSKNGKVEVLEDAGNNIVQYKVYKGEGENKKIAKQVTSVNIPMSGLYKISLKANMGIIDGAEGKDSNGNAYRLANNTALGLRFAYANSNGVHNTFPYVRYELKLLRSRGEGTFNIENCVIDGIYFKNNQKQDIEYDRNSGVDASYKFSKHPMYFPQAAQDAVLFVDPAQNKHFVCGFRWGTAANNFRHNPLGRYQGMYTVLAAKHGFSWDNNVDTINYCAINNTKGYMKYGVLGENKAGENEEFEVSVLADDETDIEIGYEKTKKHIVSLDMGKLRNKASNMAKPADADPIFDNCNDNGFAEGEAHMMVWLDKGEKLALADVSDIGYWRRSKGKAAYIKHALTFDLEIEPYRTDKEWLKMNLDGTSNGTINWSGEQNVKTSGIDLVKFLPSEQKIDEWLDNFCKAFNLQLTQPEPYKFELNLKQQRQIAAAASVVDLDGKSCIARSSNQPLNLPSAYKLGFKIDKEEEGYVGFAERHNGEYDDGGGSLSTGSIEGKELTQNTSFSYNWFKPIEHNGGEIQLPVITHKEIWKDTIDTRDYAEMQSKLYTHYTQRFWYRSEVYDAGNVWNNGKAESDKADTMFLAMVSNRIRGGRSIELSYHNHPNTILTAYFNVVASADSNYTEVECYLTPDEYERLDGSCYAKLNGDLYYIASVEGYDPTGRNPTKLKLIRKV